MQLDRSIFPSSSKLYNLEDLILSGILLNRAEQVAASIIEIQIRPLTTR